MRNETPITLDFDSQTPQNKRICKYCRQIGFALHEVVWVCCCNSDKYAHEECLRKNIFDCLTRSGDFSQLNQWVRCSECYVEYKIQYEQRLVVNCNKFRYNLSEATANITLSLAMMIILLVSVVVLVLMANDSLQVIQNANSTTKIALYSCAGVCGLLCLVLFGAFFKANFVMHVISLGKIMGIDNDEDVNELDLGGDNIVMLDFGGEQRMAMIH